ncbi:MAG: YgaP-like transmembrane domain, partial [Actinomycetota bacterium]
MMKHLDVKAAAEPERRETSTRRASGEHRRPVVNITPLERAGRVLVGAVGAVGGALLIATAGGALTTVLAGLLVLAGLDLVITGALGHCPLYRKLGYVPPSLRGQA